MKRIVHFFLLLGLGLGLGSTLAHGPDDGHSHDDRFEPVAMQLPEPEVEITERGDVRVIESNGIPNHPTGRFPNRGNPNSIRPQHYSFVMPLEPKPAAWFIPALGHPFGVALNGIPFDPGTAEAWKNDRRSGWNIQAFGPGVNLGIDRNDAHVQPTGAYHYHGYPTGLVDLLGGVRGKMLLVGYAADGFPIYALNGYRDPNDPDSGVVELKSSYALKSGTRPSPPEGPGGRYDGLYEQDFAYVEGSGDLDEANGRYGVTPEYPDGTYYYVITQEYPFIGRFLKGEPNPSFLNRGMQGPRRMPPPRRPGA